MHKGGKSGKARQSAPYTYIYIHTCTQAEKLDKRDKVLQKRNQKTCTFTYIHTYIYIHTYTQAEKLDKRDKVLQKRDQKLDFEKGKFSESVYDWERQREMEEKAMYDQLQDLSRAEQEFKVCSVCVCILFECVFVCMNLCMTGKGTEMEERAVYDQLQDLSRAEQEFRVCMFVLCILV